MKAPLISSLYPGIRANVPFFLHVRITQLISPNWRLGVMEWKARVEAAAWGTRRRYVDWTPIDVWPSDSYDGQYLVINRNTLHWAVMMPDVGQYPTVQHLINLAKPLTENPT